MLSDISRLLDDGEQLRSWAKPPFDDRDPDQKGTIDRAELFGVIQKALQAISTDPELQVEEAIREIELEGEGPVDFEEYVRKVQEALRKLVPDEKQAEAVMEAEPPEQPNDSFHEEEKEVEKEEEVSEEVREERMKNVGRFEQYVESSGIAKVFQIVFAEILTKKIEPANVFAYTAMRLRQIGKEIGPLLPSHLAPPAPPAETPSP